MHKLPDPVLLLFFFFAFFCVLLKIYNVPFIAVSPSYQTYDCPKHIFLLHFLLNLKYNSDSYFEIEWVDAVLCVSVM